ncbi:MAG: hypothetical protein WED04_06450 [Promethearchaeati archaeon SRVP18_Atabeyarchaeia-1]
MNKTHGGDFMKEGSLSASATQQSSVAALEALKEHAEDSIELLMQIDSDMNPFREKLVLNEIIADIRKASSTDELRTVVGECLDAVKNVVATYLELDRLIEEVQGELVWGLLSKK